MVFKEWTKRAWKWWICVCFLGGMSILVLAIHAYREPRGRLVYVKNPYELSYSGVYVMDPDGNNVERLTGRCIREPASPVWSPDGKQIAFGCRMNDDSYNLCVMGLEGIGWDMLCQKYRGLFDLDRVPARFCFGAIDSVSWGPNGQKLAITCSGQDREILVCIATIDGEVDCWPASIIVGEGGSVQDSKACVDWSPTQDRLAVSLGVSSYSKIFLTDLDGQNSLFLAEGQDARWSPDGKRLVFLHDDLYMINQDGSDLQCIYDLPAYPRDISPEQVEDVRTGVRYFGGSATWSPDGQYLAFSGREAIYVVSLKTKEIERITELRDGMFYDPDWSP